MMIMIMEKRLPLTGEIIDHGGGLQGGHHGPQGGPERRGHQHDCGRVQGSSMLKPYRQ